MKKSKSPANQKKNASTETAKRTDEEILAQAKERFQTVLDSHESERAILMQYLPTRINGSQK